MITIYGSSDDLVEVDGCDEGPVGEFCCDRWQGDLAAPGGAEQMRVHCWLDDDGCWQVGVGQVDEDYSLPGWPITITQAPAMNPQNAGYSALLTIDAPKGTRLTNVKPDGQNAGAR